jgi:hypothetical protein
MAQLLDTLPEADETYWQHGTLLGRLHTLHHSIIAALVDLATADDADTEQGWLDAFGDQLSPDEIAILTRAAATNHRVDHLLDGWERSAVHDTGADIDSGQNDATTSSTDAHPVTTLAGLYHQTILDLFKPTPEGAAATKQSPAADQQDAWELEDSRDPET